MGEVIYDKYVQAVKNIKYLMKALKFMVKSQESSNKMLRRFALSSDNENLYDIIMLFIEDAEGLVKEMNELIEVMEKDYNVD